MKVFITRLIPNHDFKLFEAAGIEIDSYEQDSVCPRNVLLQRVVGVDAIISQVEDGIDTEVLNAAGSNLKVITNFGIGYNNIDVAETNRRNIIVCNTPIQSLSDATAEGAIAMLFSVGKRIVKLNNQIAAGQSPEYSPIGEMGIAIRNKTIGIIGMGKIGTSIAKSMHDGFNSKVIYFNRSAKSDLDQELNAEKVELSELFKTADFIFITIAKTDGTAGLVTKELLDLMKQDSILVNISRSGIVDEAALAELVQNKKIFGAALDIYADMNPPAINENLLLTGWMVNTETQTTAEMAKLCIENIINVLSGKEPISQVQA